MTSRVALASAPVPQLRDKGANASPERGRFQSIRRSQSQRWLTFLLPLLLTSCNLPKDPDGTTERVLSSHVLRAGVTENPPWIHVQGAEVEGIEARLIRDFAQQMGAEVRWVRNGETPLLEALEKRELDIVAGGITTRSPWSSQIGMTQTYLRAKKLVAMPKGAPEPGGLKGLTVEVVPGDAAAAWLRSKDARPVPADEAAPGSGHPRVVYDFEARARGLTATRFELETEKHVLLTGPGENQFLLRLDRFLGSAESRLAGILAEETRR